MSPTQEELDRATDVALRIHQLEYEIAKLEGTIALAQERPVTPAQLRDLTRELVNRQYALLLLRAEHPSEKETTP